MIQGKIKETEVKRDKKKLLEEKVRAKIEEEKRICPSSLHFQSLLQTLKLFFLAYFQSCYAWAVNQTGM